MGFLHSPQYSLSVSLAKEWSKHSNKLISRLNSWIGICFQLKSKNCSQSSFRIHNSSSNWNALAVSHALEMFSKMLVIITKSAATQWPWRQFWPALTTNSRQNQTAIALSASCVLIREEEKNVCINVVNVNRIIVSTV